MRPTARRATSASGLHSLASVAGSVHDMRAALHGHGFSDEDAWDIGAISGLFGLSNRMANMTSMRPNDEFYLMGRLPRDKPAVKT